MPSSVPATAAAPLEEHQVIDGEPSAEPLGILGGKGGYLVHGGAAFAHCRQGVGKQTFAHAGLQTVNADHSPVGEPLLQFLNGYFAGLIGAGKAAGKGQIEDIFFPVRGTG